jgi:hypothetical protein
LFHGLLLSTAIATERIGCAQCIDIGVDGGHC